MRKVVLFLVISLLASMPAFSGEKSDWWGSLKAKISKITPTKTHTTVTAVGGLRGGKEQEEALYWKGKEPSITKDELEVFSKALDFAISGDSIRAREGFERFLSKYPSSALSDDAKKSLNMLK